jgi:hypothetical protein
MDTEEGCIQVAGQTEAVNAHKKNRIPFQSFVTMLGCQGETAGFGLLTVFGGRGKGETTTAVGDPLQFSHQFWQAQLWLGVTPAAQGGGDLVSQG